MSARSFARFANRGRRPVRAMMSLTTVLTALVVTDRSQAQISPLQDRSRSAAASGALSTDPSPAARLDPDEIVVTARRRGQADIASETELSPEQIAAYGASSIGELIGDIAPLIDGTRDAPALLVNGKRIGSPAEITDYPPEALEGVAILPPEAAAHYGYPSGQRVVNLELKEKYASWDAHVTATAPTAGGRRSTALAAGRTAIDGDARWNVQANVSDDTALRKSARRLPVRDDVLALLPTLQNGDGIDPNRFETVVGAARSWDLNAGVNRPIGAFAVAASVNAALSRSAQLVGIPIGSIVLPPGSPQVPAAGDAITLSRLLGDEALQSRQRSATFGASATASGPIGGWQTSLSVFYAHNRSNNIYDRGYDVRAVQQRVDAGDPAFDPYGIWPATPLLSDRTRFRSDSLSATLNASKSVIELPAGPVNASLTVNAIRTRSRFASETGDGVQRDRPGSNQLEGRWSFTIPVASRARGVLAPLGEMGLDLSAEAGIATRTRTRRKYSAGVRWAPFPFLDLRASLGHENVAPTFDQLYGPRIEVISRIFDFVRQEYVQPIRIFGGNPDLAGGRIRTLAINAMVRPFGGDLATFDMGYRRQVSRGALGPLPALTPEVEAAFPGRIRRDADGRLLSIDARPVNIAQDRTESISSGLTLRYTQKQAGEGDPSAANAPRPWTVNLSVNHSWQLSSAMLIRPGLPVIDRLRGNGQPRHNVALNLVVGRRGMGATLNGNWASGARVRSAGDIGGGAEFRYAPSMLFNLSLFVEPGPHEGGGGERNWMSGVRVSIDVQNVLNGYRKVSVSGGGVPRGYSRDEIDPLGRTIRLSVRKQF